MKHRILFLLLSALSILTSIPAHSTDKGCSPLIDAVRSNNLCDVAQLLEKGENPLTADTYGRIPLHYAANCFHKPISALLLGYDKSKMQLIHTSNKGNSALDFAYKKFATLKSSDEKRPQAKKYLGWLERKYNSLKKVPLVESYFSPKIAPTIIDLINREEAEIIGAMYHFTYYPIAQAMIQKKQADENFNVELVLHKQLPDFCSTMKELAKNKCTLYAHQWKKKYENMHHKFIILSNINGLPLLINGSYNYTGQAEENNQENITIIHDQEAIGKFTKEFLVLKNNSNRINLKELSGEKDNWGYTQKMNKYPPYNK